MNLSERFARSRGAAIEVDGRRVHAIYRRSVQSNERFELTLRRFRSPPVQGLRVKLDSGSLQFGDHPEPVVDAVVWTDTAPEVVWLRCMHHEPTELLIWNCWRDERGVTQAWIGNSGMEIHERGDGITELRCNSTPELSFEDLVVDVERVP